MIKTLKIHHLRNLSDIDVSLGAVNVFVGNNGSGKTSLLEAIYLLSRGKSFRHFEAKRYISHHHDSCTVWADLTETTLAITKHKDDSKNQIRYNHTPAPNQSLLTKHLPVLLIDPSGMDILEDGSANRRQLLDFLCFHCTGEFHGVWLNYQRLLKQRNALLKTAQSYPKNTQAYHSLVSQIKAWDNSMSQYASQLHALRQAVFDEWQVVFDDSVASLLPSYGGQIGLGYQAGFDTDHALKDLLGERLEQDIELGYTRIGNHRADLTIGIKTTLDNGKTHKEQAVNVLSRGEKKLLITALKLSGLPQICRHAPSTPMVLIDDIDSELDDKTNQLLLQTLLNLPCQLFISSLNDALPKMIKNNLANDKTIKAYRIQAGQVLKMDNE